MSDDPVKHDDPDMPVSVSNLSAPAGSNHALDALQLNTMRYLAVDPAAPGAERTALSVLQSGAFQIRANRHANAAMERIREEFRAHNALNEPRVAPESWGLELFRRYSNSNFGRDELARNAMIQGRQLGRSLLTKEHVENIVGGMTMPPEAEARMREIMGRDSIVIHDIEMNPHHFAYEARFTVGNSEEMASIIIDAGTLMDNHHYSSVSEFVSSQVGRQYLYDAWKDQRRNTAAFNTKPVARVCDQSCHQCKSYDFYDSKCELGKDDDDLCNGYHPMSFEQRQKALDDTAIRIRDEEKALTEKSMRLEVYMREALK